MQITTKRLKGVRQRRRFQAFGTSEVPCSVNTTVLVQFMSSVDGELSGGVLKG